MTRLASRGKGRRAGARETRDTRRAPPGGDGAHANDREVWRRFAVRFAVWLAERVAVGARGDEVTEAFLDESDRAAAAFILPQSISSALLLIRGKHA